MDWEKILEQAAEVVKAHKDAALPEQARMLQAQFRDQPILGWLILQQLHLGEDRRVDEDGN